jgi:hypothetical protein
MAKIDLLAHHTHLRRSLQEIMDVPNKMADAEPVMMADTSPTRELNVLVDLAGAPLPNEMIAAIFQWIPYDIFRCPPSKSWRELAIDTLSTSCRRCVSTSCKYWYAQSNHFVDPFGRSPGYCLMHNNPYYRLQQISVGLAKLFPGKYDWVRVAKIAPEWLVRRFVLHIKLSQVERRWSEEFIRDFRRNISWAIISNIPMTAEFVKEFASHICWPILAASPHLTDEIIRKYCHVLDWFIVSGNQVVSDEIIAEFAARISWADLSRTRKMSPDFARKYSHKVKWHMVPEGNLTMEVIRAVPDKICWMYFAYESMTAEFMAEFGGRIVWGLVPHRHVIPEAVMRRYYQRMNWPAVSRYQVLTEEFIEDYRGCVEWGAIFAFQRLSVEFMARYWAKFDLGRVMALKIRAKEEHAAEREAELGIDHEESRMEELD